MRKEQPKVVAFDFDQTIALYDPKYWKTKYVVKIPIKAKPNKNIVKLMWSLYKNEYKIIIYTSRWWGDYYTIKSFLDKHAIPYHDIICGRFLADVYICDKSINPNYPDVSDRCYDMLLGGK